jgi:hypothetical protein
LEQGAFRLVRRRQHIVGEVYPFGRLSDPDAHARERLRAQRGDNRLHAVVPARRAFRAHAHRAWRKPHIVEHHQHLVGRKVVGV